MCVYGSTVKTYIGNLYLKLIRNHFTLPEKAFNKTNVEVSCCDGGGNKPLNDSNGE